MTRLFLSVGIPDHEAFHSLYNELRTFGHGLKPVRPDNQHITLKFIGEPHCSAHEVRQAPIGTMKGYPSHEILLDRIGVFPNWETPSVLWIGARQTGELRKMAAELDTVLNQTCSIPRDRREFRAHITVARIRRPARIDAGTIRSHMDRCLSDLKESGYSILVDRVRLMNSTLTPEGPVYKVIEEYPLGPQ